MSKQFEPITGVVTTDLSAITRGRFVAERRVHDIKGVGVGWRYCRKSL
jgi:glutamine synthetase